MKKFVPSIQAISNFFRSEYLTTPSFFYRTFLHRSFGEAPQEPPFRDLDWTCEKEWNPSNPEFRSPAVVVGDLHNHYREQHKDAGSQPFPSASMLRVEESNVSNSNRGDEPGE